jgi:hypothetical protein
MLMPEKSVSLFTNKTINPFKKHFFRRNIPPATFYS